MIMLYQTSIHLSRRLTLQAQSNLYKLKRKLRVGQKSDE